MLVIFEQLSILYIFLLIGWLIGKLKKDKASHSDILSVLLVNVFLPCKIFDTFSKNVSVSYFTEKYPVLFASLILLTIIVTMSHLIPKLLTKNAYERRIYNYSFTITNYGYLGYALIGSVFGHVVLTNFMLFAIPFIFYTYTAGYVMLTGGKCTVKKLLTPITAAIVIGIIIGLTGLNVPNFISSAVSKGAACTGPLGMLLTGMTLAGFSIKELISNKTAYIFTFLRLIGIPAIAFLVCKLFNLDSLLPMMLIITCMPCGLNTIIFPKITGDDCKPGARLALITHVFSLATIPFWLSFIQ